MICDKKCLIQTEKLRIGFRKFNFLMKAGFALLFRKFRDSFRQAIGSYLLMHHILA